MTQSNALEVAIHEAHDWSGFAQVRRLLTAEFEATEEVLVEGPDAAKAILRIAGYTVDVQFEDTWGTSLFAHSEPAKAALPNIAARVRKGLTSTASADA